MVKTESHLIYKKRVQTGEEMNISELIKKGDASSLHQLLSLSDAEDIQALHSLAYQTKVDQIGKKVYLRGLIEASNICSKNCYYCGIRSGNPNFQRFEMSEEEIIQSALWAYENHYGSVVIQAGERTDQAFTDKITSVIQTLKEKSQGQIGITLSLGEQSEEIYRRWFDAGAHRYLLRIESSNPQLYQKLHPSDHDYSARVACLDLLKKIGYQVGTGVMIGLPGQSIDDLVHDVLFFKTLDIDMLGMGPYQIHEDTPLAEQAKDNDPMANFELSLKMIAVCRLMMPKINIAASTALQAIKHDGRELGLLAGANIIMPNVTDIKYRELYQLYKDKPCLDENASQCKFCLENRVRSIGEEIIYDAWGDSLHFKSKQS